MFTYGSEVEVAQTPAEVFSALLDIGRWTEWTDMRDMHHDQSGPIRIGSSGTFTLPGPFRGPIRYELTGLEPDRHVRYEMAHSAFAWTAEYSLEPTESGTRLATSGRFQLRGLWRILQPIIAREMGRGEADELARLKAIIEEVPARPSAAVSA
ncbi:MAG TPA: SRPBCC family protein [Candidatus Limnocylindria bacterium]|jgi:hypothetical protein